MDTTLDLPALKSALETELTELCQLDALASEGAQIVELDQSKVGRLSRMDALQQQAMQQEQHRRRERKIKQIRSALVRIAQGDYGWCLDCGEQIKAQRLEINPSVEYCTLCADAQLP